MNWSYQAKNMLRGWIILILLLGTTGISMAAAPVEYKSQTEWVAGGKKKKIQQFFLTRSYPKKHLTHTNPWQHALPLINRSVQVQFTTWLQKEFTFVRCPILLSRIIPQADEPALSVFIL
jgi:hypothetical protein